MRMGHEDMRDPPLGGIQNRTARIHVDPRPQVDVHPVGTVKRRLDHAILAHLGEQRRQRGANRPALCRHAGVMRMARRPRRILPGLLLVVVAALALVALLAWVLGNWGVRG